MAQLIVLIQPAQDTFAIQVNQHETLETFNLIFSRDNFPPSITLPSITNKFSLYGDRHTVTLSKLTKELPKMWEKSNDLPQFILALTKKYKVDCYQINISSCFDDSMVKPFSVSSILDIAENLKRFDFSLVI